MDQVRLEAADDTAQSQHILQQISPAENLLTARPLHLLDFRRDRPVFHLPRSALQAYVIDLMPTLGQGRQKAVVVRGVIERKIDDFHVFRNEPTTKNTPCGARDSKERKENCNCVPFAVKDLRAQVGPA